MFLTINFFFLNVIESILSSSWLVCYDSLDKDPRKKKKLQRIVNKPLSAPRSYQLSHDTTNTHTQKVTNNLRFSVIMPLLGLWHCERAFSNVPTSQVVVNTWFWFFKKLEIKGGGEVGDETCGFLLLLWRTLRGSDREGCVGKFVLHWWHRPLHALLWLYNSLFGGMTEY